MTGDANASARRRAPATGEGTLRALLTADDVARRDAALSLVDVAAGGLEPPTVEALDDRARNDGNPRVRQFAVEALGVAGEGLDAVEATLDDAEAWVRAEAVVALSRAAADVEEAVRRCLDDPNGWVRRNALIALGEAGAIDPPALRSRLRDDPHGPVREYAAAYLAATPGDVAETVTLLAAVLARDSDAFVRARAAQSLGELGTERSIEALETQGLGDRSDDVRRTAKRALATARGRAPAGATATGEGPAPDGRPGRQRPAGGRGRPGRAPPRAGAPGRPGEAGDDGP